MLANCATSDPFIQAEPVTITYSYWDGSGHRRTITVKKGDTVGQFLSAVRQQLQPEFREMRATSVENILYVKEGTRRHLLLPAVLRAPSVRAAVGGTVQRERGPPNLLRPCPGRVVLRVETCR